MFELLVVEVVVEVVECRLMMFEVAVEVVVVVECLLLMFEVEVEVVEVEVYHLLMKLGVVEEVVEPMLKDVEHLEQVVEL